MKKPLALLICVLLSAQITACSSNSAGAPSSTTDKNGTTSSLSSAADKSIGVNKGLFDVSITFPASMFAGLDLDAIKKHAGEQGIKNVTQNSDGSITYKMSKSEHKKLMKETKDTTVKSLNEYKESKEYESITDVKYNDDFSQIQFTADKEKYENSMDAFVALGAGLQGMFYQILDGKKSDEISVKVDFIDSKTGDVLNSATYPDAFDTSSSSK